MILALGAILGKSTRGTQGIMETLPYILIGIGSGIFGQNLGTFFNILSMEKDPEKAKQKEIILKDERNITIRNKAKAYELMIYAFGALLIAFGLMNVSSYVIIPFVAVYLFVILSNIYLTNKYSKEM
jgi:hypothetical protein